MMQSLQTTMKEHSTLQQHEKNGDLKPELVDNAISKFNFNIKKDFKKYWKRKEEAVRFPNDHFTNTNIYLIEWDWDVRTYEILYW